MFNLFKNVKKQKEEVTCFGCEHLLQRNDGGYECLINAERACINGKKERRLYKKEQQKPQETMCTTVGISED